jgi:hypothetical protein
MRALTLVVGGCWLVLSDPLQAFAQSDARGEQASREQICQMLESAAQANHLPVEFLVRLIWQESRFRPDAVGPITRTGERAQGIAQFMSSTAAERHLLQPFDPMEALPKSAEFLAELRDEFGNLGLAAAAYNAGPQRVREFIAGSRHLPLETQNYVLAVTGHPVDDWLKPVDPGAIQGTDRAVVPCRDFAASLGEEPNGPVRPPHRLLPSWCRGLNHPNPVLCGSVHQRQTTFASRAVVAETPQHSFPSWCKHLHHPNPALCGAAHAE